MTRKEAVSLMNPTPTHSQVIDLPPGRRLMANANRLYWQKHFMYGLLEVDVTIVRRTARGPASSCRSPVT